MNEQEEEKLRREIARTFVAALRMAKREMTGKLSERMKTTCAMGEILVGGERPQALIDEFEDIRHRRRLTEEVFDEIVKLIPM